MPKVLLMGAPGSGKTYVSGKMKEKGYPAVDADGIPGIHQFHHRVTGEILDKEPDTASNWLPGFTEKVRSYNIPFIDAILSADEIIGIISAHKL